MSTSRVLTCEEALRFLAVYLDGELETATQLDVQTHLARCQSCYSRAEFERRMKVELAALGRSDVRTAFAERIRRLLHQFTSTTGPES